MITVLYILPLFYLTESAQTTSSQCHSYKTLPRDSERSKDNSILPANHNALPCDDVTDGWYKFSSGEIATSCVPANHCGTTSTIWMRDPVPETGETLENDFCVNHKTWSTKDNNCCLFSFKANVTNCDGYMVYYFQKHSVLCPSGYCTGDLKPCLPGATSPTGFEPCVETYPGMEFPPTLHPPVLSKDGNDFTMTCDIWYRGSNPDASFLVMWLFDGQISKMTTLRNGTTATSLTSADWKGHFGKKLTCLVESYFESKGTHSHFMKSNEYFGGVQINPESAIIHEGSAVKVSIQSTLPTLCPQTSPDKCKVDIQTVITGSHSNNLFTDGLCSMSWKASDWDPKNNRTEVTTQLYSLTDPVMKSDQNYKISFNLHHNISSLPRSLELNVTTKDEPHHMCFVVGESEVHGFTKQTSYMMGTRALGDILLYKGTDSTGRILQVQIRTHGPVGSFPVGCAVALQYGNTLVKVDMCHNNINLAAPVVSQGGGTSGDVKVYHCDSEFEIVTDDGVQLTVIPRYVHLDIKLHLPPTYSPNSEGGCCYSKSSLQWSDADIGLYSLHDDRSLFKNAGSPFLNATNSRAKTAGQSYCKCGDPTLKCNPFRRIEDPKAPYGFTPSGIVHSKPRCAEYIPRPLNADFGVFSSLHVQPGVSPKLIHPAILNSNIARYGVNTISEEDCRATIMAYASPYCRSKYFDDLKDSVRICLYDAKGSHFQRQFSISSVQAFEWMCEERALSKESTYSTDISGRLIPPPELTSDLCPNFCSLSGVCAHGTCSCTGGRLGPDCFVPSTVRKPVILGVKGDQYCKMSSLHCVNPILVTRYVYPSDKLQARVRAVQLVNGSFQKSITEYPTTLVYESHYSVSLSLSNILKSLKDEAAYGMFITITNDGQTYSNYYEYFLFDDKCLDCQREQCTQKPNTCHVDGKCYSRGDLNPSNPAEVCNPSPFTGVGHWSPVTSHISSGTQPNIVG